MPIINAVTPICSVMPALISSDPSVVELKDEPKDAVVDPRDAVELNEAVEE